MNKLITFIAFVFIFSSCKDNTNNNLSVFKAINEGLEQSNKVISSNNDIIYRVMEERLADPKTSEAMKVWQPKAMKVKELSDSMVNFIRRLKEDLVSEAGPVKPEDKDALERNETVVDHVFQSHGKGKELFEKLINYRREMLSVDPILNKALENDVIIFSKYFDQSINDADEFEKAFFNKKPAIAARAMLSQIENNIKVSESNFITFCNSRMCIIEIIYDSFAPLVSLSSSYVKGGDEIEINAGVGAFSTVAQPRITINNISIAVNANGLGIYRLKTPLKSGKYQVPIKIEFTKEDGTKELMTRNVEYTVIEPN